MRTRDIFLALFLLVFATTLFAQETTPETPPAVPPGRSMEMVPPMPPMNPTMLLRMRNGLTVELQEIQRVIGLVNPGDTQLLDMHKQRQKEVVDQLKDIETQLKAQGVPTEQAGVPGNAADAANAGVPANLPGDPNLLIQRQPAPQMMSPQMPPGFQMMNPAMPPQPSVNPYSNPADAYGPVTPGITAPNSPVPGMPVPPNGFDQDQAWNNSPWVPQPSKELTEMKQTVESLRKEIGELKANVKALETQIQLLNRNILLSQPQAPAN